MMVSQERLAREDWEFWNAVLQVCQLLIPELGLPMPSFVGTDDLCTTKAMVKGGEAPKAEDPLGRYHRVMRSERSALTRIVYQPGQPVSGMDQILTFFSASPEWMVPMEGYACYLGGDWYGGPVPDNFRKWHQVTGLNGPAALDEHGLLLMLCEIVARFLPQYDDYAFALCRQVDPFFQELNIQDLGLENDYQHLPVTALAGAMGVLYPLWLRYLRRHYDRRLWGTDKMGAVRAVVNCLDGSRYIRKTMLLRSVRETIFSLSVIDGTLCLPRGEHGMTPIRVLTRNMGLSGSEKELTKLLRMYQQAVVSEERKKRRENEESDSVRRREIEFRQGVGGHIVSYDRTGRQFRDKQYLGETTGWRTPVQIKIPQQLDLELPVEYLYRLTGGDEAVLRELAKAAALCALREKSVPKVIVTDSEGALLLQWIAGELAEKPFLLSALCKPGAADELIARKQERRSVLLAQHDGKRMSAEGWKRLGKLISGATVTYNDPVLGRKKHRNAEQWLILGDDLTVQEFTKHGIQTVHVKCRELLKDFERPGTSDWIKIFLPLWGLMQLSGRGGVKSAKQQMPRTLEKFWTDCCDLDGKSDFIPARTAYDAYRVYCGEQGYSGILLFKDFNREVEERFGLKRVRRHRTDSNFTGYIGLRLTENTHPQENEEEQRRQKFDDLLRQIEDEVRAALPEDSLLRTP